MISYDIPPHISGDTWRGIPSITIQKNFSAVDLTDCTYKMQVRASLDSPVIMEITENNGIFPISSTNGIVAILPMIVDIPIGNYVYNFKITFPTGEVKTEISGNWHIIANVPQ